jgi:hypothetical protein
MGSFCSCETNPSKSPRRFRLTLVPLHRLLFLFCAVVHDTADTLSSFDPKSQSDASGGRAWHSLAVVVLVAVKDVKELDELLPTPTLKRYNLVIFPSLCAHLF